MIHYLFEDLFGIVKDQKGRAVAVFAIAAAALLEQKQGSKKRKHRGVASTRRNETM